MLAEVLNFQGAKPILGMGSLSYLERGANMPEESKVSKAQQKAVNKYVKNNYDRINVTFPKGQKEIIMQAAEAAGESVNGYIKKAVDQRMERDNA